MNPGTAPGSVNDSFWIFSAAISKETNRCLAGNTVVPQDCLDELIIGTGHTHNNQDGLTGDTEFISQEGDAVGF